MKTVFRLIVCLLLIVGWGLAALSLHVVRTPDSIPITLVPKERFGVTDTYVDTRNWTVNDAAQHPAVVQKLISIGKADLLKHVVGIDTHGSTTAQTGLTAEDISRVLNESIRTAAHETRDRSTRPSSAAQTARSGLGWF